MPAPADPAVEKRLRAEQKMQPGPHLPDCRLVHYDGLTPLHWRLKILRYALEYGALLEAGVKNPFAARLPSRLRQIRRLYESKDTRATFAQMQPLIMLEPERQARLSSVGGVTQNAPDPCGAARRLVPGAHVFSPASFDAALRARRGELIEQYGLDL